MSELSLPRTDAGVAVQVLVVGLVSAVALWRVRSRPDVWLIVVGLVMMAVGPVGLRAAH